MGDGQVGDHMEAAVRRVEGAQNIDIEVALIHDPAMEDVAALDLLAVVQDVTTTAVQVSHLE